MINNIELESVNNFAYLRRKITSDGKITTDIISKIAQNKQTIFKKKKNIHHKNFKH